MESRVARLEQQVETHEGDIRRFAPLMVEVAENRVRLEQVKQGTDQVVAEFKQFRTQQDQRDEARRKAESERDEQTRRERKKDRQWMIGTVLATGALIVSAIALLGPFA